MPHTSDPSSSVLHQRDEPLKCLILKTNEYYVQGKHRAVGKKTLLSKGPHADLLILGQCKNTAVWKKPRP